MTVTRVCILILSLIFLVSCSNNKETENQNKTVHINLSVLFENFTYSAEMKKEITEFRTINEYKIDSLEKVLENEASRLNSLTSPTKKEVAAFEISKQHYFNAKNNFEGELQEISNKVDGQIWERLNLYVKEFGEKKGYLMILGVNGSGSIMYADKSIDVTDEVIEFCNSRYNGEN